MWWFIFICIWYCFHYIYIVIAWDMQLRIFEICNLGCTLQALFSSLVRCFETKGIRDCSIVKTESKICHDIALCIMLLMDCFIVIFKCDCLPCLYAGLCNDHWSPEFVLKHSNMCIVCIAKKSIIFMAMQEFLMCITLIS